MKWVFLGLFLTGAGSVTAGYNIDWRTPPDLSWPVIIGTVALIVDAVLAMGVGVLCSL